MRNDFPAISDSRTRSSPAKPRELAPRPWPDREQGAKTSNAKGIEPETPFRTPTPKTRDADRRHAKGRRQTREARARGPERKRPRTQEAPNARGPEREKAARPRGGRRPFFFAKTRGAPANERGGPPRVPPSQAPRSRIPAPSPAQRAPGAGGALVSHRVAPAVPSALAGLTSGFGMGPGVPRPPGPPAPGGRCGAGCEGAGRRSGRPGGRTALEEGAL